MRVAVIIIFLLAGCGRLGCDRTVGTIEACQDACAVVAKSCVEGPVEMRPRCVEALGFCMAACDGDFPPDYPARRDP